MHFNNYSLFEMPGQNMSFYTFKARDVKIGNFSFNETLSYGKTVPTMIDNQFPHLLL